MSRMIGQILPYEPIGWQKSLGYKVDEDRCKATVFGERVSLYQCLRKPKRKIHGVLFCEQHAKMAEKPR